MSTESSTAHRVAACLAHGSLALPAKGEAYAFAAPTLLHWHPQEFQVVDAVHVHVRQVRQPLPLLLLRVIHLLRVCNHIAHE